MADQMQYDNYDMRIEKRLAPKDNSLDVLAERIAELKALFKKDYDDNKELYDRRDYDRFFDSKDDWYARRWIIYQRDVPTAFEMAKDTLRWRKELDLNNLSYEDFPREFYECGCVFEYGKDKRGRNVIYIRCRLFRPMNELSELYDKYFAFMIDQCDKRSKSRGFSMMYDVTDAGLSNVEMSTLKFMTSLRDRFPLSSRQILIAGLPWVLTPVFKLVMSIIPASQAAAFKLINLEDLNQYIDENQIPTSMGGTSKSKFQVVPAKSRSATEFECLSKSASSKLRKHVDSKTSPEEYEIVPTLRVLR